MKSRENKIFIDLKKLAGNRFMMQMLLFKKVYENS